MDIRGIIYELLSLLKKERVEDQKELLDEQTEVYWMDDRIKGLESQLSQGTCCNLLCQTEKIQLEKKCKILQSAIDRWVPCPDHRDKTIRDKCYICENERLERKKKELESEVKRLQERQKWIDEV